MLELFDYLNTFLAYVTFGILCYAAWTFRREPTFWQFFAGLVMGYGIMYASDVFVMWSGHYTQKGYLAPRLAYVRLVWIVQLSRLLWHLLSGYSTKVHAARQRAHPLSPPPLPPMPSP